jgi:hypothetical protein
MDDSMALWTPGSSSQPEVEAEEAEYILELEEFEVRELVASMEEQQETASQHYGSDDEDYDSIFMECASTTDTRRPHEHELVPQFDASFDDVDDMDMS